MIKPCKLRKLQREMLHRAVNHPRSIGQHKLGAFVERALQCLVRLRATMHHDDGFKIRLERCIFNQRRIKPPPNQRPCRAVVFKQLVIDGQAHLLKAGDWRAAQQSGKPAVKSPNLHRPATVQHALVQICQLLAQLWRRLRVFLACNAAQHQLPAQGLVIGMGKLFKPFVKPLAHLPSGLFGEGDRQNLLRAELVATF